MSKLILNKTLDLNLADMKIDGEDGVFKGYASKYNGVDSYGDTILPGAYAKVVSRKKNLPIFLNHETREVPLGIYTVLKDTDAGLYVEGRLTLSIQRARDVYEALKTGALNGLSVGIALAAEDYELKDPRDPWSGRTIKNVSDLREISVCTYPADSNARISAVKSQDIKSIRDLETALRDAGLSKSDALAFIAKAKEINIDEKSRRDSVERVERDVVAKVNKLMQTLDSYTTEKNR